MLWRNCRSVIEIHKKPQNRVGSDQCRSHDFRLRSLRFVAGEDGTVITQENGDVYCWLTLRGAIFTKLSYGRMRIAKHLETGEIVLNMFAGACCFSILVAALQGLIGPC
jgi:tRNA G37 N-methylase Trm5